jgi:hypothetical protein
MLLVRRRLSGEWPRKSMQSIAIVSRLLGGALIARTPQRSTSRVALHEVVEPATMHDRLPYQGNGHGSGNPLGVERISWVWPDMTCWMLFDAACTRTPRSQVGISINNGFDAISVRA